MTCRTMPCGRPRECMVGHLNSRRQLPLDRGRISTSPSPYLINTHTNFCTYSQDIYQLHITPSHFHRHTYTRPFHTTNKHLLHNLHDPKLNQQYIGRRSNRTALAFVRIYTSTSFPRVWIPDHKEWRIVRYIPLPRFPSCIHVPIHIYTGAQECRGWNGACEVCEAELPHLWIGERRRSKHGEIDMSVIHTSPISLTPGKGINTRNIIIIIVTVIAARVCSSRSCDRVERDCKIATAIPLYYPFRFSAPPHYRMCGRITAHALRTIAHAAAPSHVRNISPPHHRTCDCTAACALRSAAPSHMRPHDRMCRTPLRRTIATAAISPQCTGLNSRDPFHLVAVTLQVYLSYLS